MFSIKEIVDFINEIVKIGGKRVSINTIASVLGFSVKTNSFRAKISTAKQFGLIRGSNGAVELTELAKRIVYPVNELDTRRAIVESFYRLRYIVRSWKDMKTRPFLVKISLVIYFF